MRLTLFAITLATLAFGGGLYVGSVAPLDLAVPPRPTYTVSQLLRGTIVSLDPELRAVEISVDEKSPAGEGIRAQFTYDERTRVAFFRYRREGDAVVGLEVLRDTAFKEGDQVILLASESPSQLVATFIVARRES